MTNHFDKISTVYMFMSSKYLLHRYCNLAITMAPTLYMTQRSPPCRAVLMTAKAIGLTLDEKEVDFLHGDQLKPEYLQINPQHTIPTLVDDDGFIIWDSHAIMAYLVSKYAKNDALYPKDLKKRAVVDQRLYFESGIMFTTLDTILIPLFLDKTTSISEKDMNSVNAMYVFLEAFLEGKQWAAGDSVTIADYSWIAMLSGRNSYLPVDPQKFPNVVAWMKRVEDLPEYEVNKQGAELSAAFVKNKLGK